MARLISNGRSVSSLTLSAAALAFYFVAPAQAERKTNATQQAQELVQEALEDFLDPAFNIDIYKLEPPCSMVPK